MLQHLRFGNTYRHLSDEEAEQLGCTRKPDGSINTHEWTMELRFECPEDAALVQKVTYTLHQSFSDPVVHVTEGPSFQLTRVGWGTFEVHASLCLFDGRTLNLTHGLSFDQPETFRSCWQALRLVPTPIPAPEGDLHNGVVRSTFLFTDGLANHGITSVADICAAAGSMLDELGDRRCTLSAFGFGRDHSAEMLMKLAEVGQGSYSFVENEDQIGAAFGEALGGLLSTTHQNTRLCLELSPGIHFGRACTDYSVDIHTLENGAVSVEIELGDLFAEEKRDILLELDLPDADKSAEECVSEIAKLSACGFSILAKRSENVGPIIIELKRRADISDGVGLANPVVERHRCRYLTTEALKAAKKAGERGDLDDARRHLTETLKMIETAGLANKGDSMILSFIADLNECRDDLRNRETYTYSGSKKLANCHMAHGKQRAMNCPSTEMYSNSRQMSMKCAFREHTKSGK